MINKLKKICLLVLPVVALSGCARMLILASEGKESPNIKGVTELHTAACNGDLTKVNELLSRGASVSARTWRRKKYDGGTPLNYAVECDRFGGITNFNLQVIETLLRAGADPNVANEWRHNNTPLFAVAKSNSKDPENKIKAMELLISYGAQIEPEKDQRSWESPLDVVARRKDVETLTFLLQHGAKVKSEELQSLVQNYFTICADKDVNNAQQEAFDKSKRTLDALFANGLYVHPNTVAVMTRSCEGKVRWDAASKKAVPLPSTNAMAQHVESKYASKISATYGKKIEPFESGSKIGSKVIGIPPKGGVPERGTPGWSFKD